MKKGIFILAFLLIAITSNAQEIADNTIGIRLGHYYGVGPEISYQKKLSDNSRLEAGLSWRGHVNYNDIKLVGLYQRVFNFEPLEGMNWYVGAGGGVGFWNYNSGFYYYDNGRNKSNGVYFLAAGNGGVEYKFKFPLLVSFDARPEFGFGSFRSGFNVDVAVGARYTFN